MKTPNEVQSETQQRDPRELRNAALLGLGAASLVASLRAVMVLLGRGLFDGPLDLSLANRFARQVTEHMGLALMFFLGLSLAGVALRRRSTGLRLAAPVAAFYAFFSWAFISLRLPVELHTHPDFATTRGMLANGGAALAGLVVVSVVMLGLFAPAFVRKPVAIMRGFGLALLVLVFGLRVAPLLESSVDGRPNVILISLDTLRPDHLRSYGYERETAPNLTAFADQALRFEQAFTNHPWTLTAHATMMTGMTPTAHGVNKKHALDHEIPTVAGLLRDSGYTTFGIVDKNDWLHPRFGYARGFQRYKRMATGAGPKVVEILDSIDDALSAREGPFFAFGHFYDVHSDWHELPYDSDAEDRERFASDYTGDFTGCGPDQGCASKYLLGLNQRDEKLSAEDLDYTRDLYDAGIATLDRRLGALFAGLEERGLFENTVVIVTADHGEELGDHGRMLHSQLFDECLRVPLLIRSPRGPRGEASDELVGLVDLASTILDLGDLDCSEYDTFQGRSLAPLVQGWRGVLAPAHPILLDTGAGTFGLRTPGYSIIQKSHGKTLFDLHKDPGQLEDIAGGALVRSGELNHLRRALNQRREASLLLHKKYSKGRAAKIPKAGKKALAKLGYGGDED